MLSKNQEQNLIQIIISTPKHKLKIDCLFDFIETSKISINKGCFLEMCKSGCRNYNQKYSCPPLSPSFKLVTKDKPYLFVLMLKIDLSQLSNFNYAEYHKLRIGNAVIKPRIEKIMRLLEKEFNTKYISTGTCRLCKPCQKKLQKPCKHPDKMRFSLESLGVDCNKLSKDVFNIPLLWFANKTCPKYTAVVCALPFKDINLKDKIINLTFEILRKIQ